MEDKKDFFYFVISTFSFLSLFYLCIYFFLHLTHPQMESAVDEVRSFRCTVGSGQDAWRVVTTGWCHVSTEYYKATIMTWSFFLNLTWVGLKHITAEGDECASSLSQIQLSAANTMVLFQLGECTRCWCRNEISNDMHRLHKKGFQTEMHNCNVLWINSLLERDWIETEELFLEMTQFRH